MENSLQETGITVRKVGHLTSLNKFTVFSKGSECNYIILKTPNRIFLVFGQCVAQAPIRSSFRCLSGIRPNFELMKNENLRTSPTLITHC